LGFFDRRKKDTTRKQAPRRGPPTAEERARLEERLLEHDLEGALIVAMNCAMKKTRDNEMMARQLVMRARAKLWERCSWDPKKVKLDKYLCGVIRSEVSHDAETEATRREEESEYLAEAETIGGRYEPSPEDLAVRHEESGETRGEAVRELDKLRAHFVAAGDEVNVLWIDYSLEGIDEPAAMARLSGRDVKEFYRASDRRVRLVQRMLAARRGGPKK
jgi:hypothetical protein